MTQFFNVSKEYLIGESEEKQPEYAWNDPEIMETVRENLPVQLSDLNDILKNSPDQEQKLVFDILTELAHVLKLPDAAQRTAAISLLEGVFAASTRYADVCIGAVQDIDLTRMEKAKKTALSQYGVALDTAVFFIPIEYTCHFIATTGPCLFFVRLFRFPQCLKTQQGGFNQAFSPDIFCLRCWPQMPGKPLFSRRGHDFVARTHFVRADVSEKQKKRPFKRRSIPFLKWPLKRFLIGPFNGRVRAVCLDFTGFSGPRRVVPRACLSPPLKRS